MAAHRQGQMLCMDMLTALLDDVTFMVHPMAFYSAELFVKLQTLPYCLRLIALGMAMRILLSV